MPGDAAALDLLARGEITVKGRMPWASNATFLVEIRRDAGTTLAAASTNEADLRAAGSGSSVEAASRVGQLIAERTKAAGVDKVVFDRGGFAYHGRIAAVASAAREAGLEF